jgi:Xaa-Pro aminopeptidase
LILPLDSDPVFVVHQLKKERIQKGSWIRNIRSYSQLFSAPVDIIASVFDEIGLSRGTIGAELGFEQRLQMTFSDFMRLNQVMNRAKFIDASDVLWKMRMTKSNTEIGYAKRSCDILSKALECTFEEIERSMNERQIFNIFCRHILNEGADSVPIFIVNTGPTNGSRPPSERIHLHSGNLLWIDAASAFRGYYSDFSRIGVIGTPSIKQKELHKRAWEAMQWLIDLIHPGTSASEVFETYEKYISQPDMRPLKSWSSGRIGHGVGLMCTEPPSIASCDSTILRSGMLLALELGFPSKEGTFHVEETVVVTDSGCKVLSEISRDLFML